MVHKVTKQIVSADKRGAWESKLMPAAAIGADANKKAGNLALCVLSCGQELDWRAKPDLIIAAVFPFAPDALNRAIPCIPEAVRQRVLAAAVIWLAVPISRTLDRS